MANAGVPAGKKDKQAPSSGGKVEFLTSGENENGVPDGQTPGFGRGNKEVSLNQLTSNARVVKPATSNLMQGMSQSRGAGGAK
jgi:hypothetical protein